MSTPVVVALGSNLGDRRYLLARAVEELGRILNVVRVSKFIETAPVDAPAGSGQFLNAVVAGLSNDSPERLLARLHEIETRLGRHRGLRNAPRTMDLDLILFGAAMKRSRTLTLPHPRYRQRSFVLDPLRSLNLGWVDPVTGLPI